MHAWQNQRSWLHNQLSQKILHWVIVQKSILFYNSRLFSLFFCPHISHPAKVGVIDSSSSCGGATLAGCPGKYWISRVCKTIFSLWFIRFWKFRMCSLLMTLQSENSHIFVLFLLNLLCAVTQIVKKGHGKRAYDTWIVMEKSLIFLGWKSG